MGYGLFTDDACYWGLINNVWWSWGLLLSACILHAGVGVGRSRGWFSVVVARSALLGRAARCQVVSFDMVYT